MRRLILPLLAVVGVGLPISALAGGGSPAPSAATIPVVSFPAGFPDRIAVGGSIVYTPATTTAPTTTTRPTTTTAPASSSTTTSTSTTMAMPMPTTTVQAATTTTVPSAGFSESFTGNTGFDRFHWGVYRRDVYEIAETSWSADHNMACSTPDMKRTIDIANPADDFFACADHLMVSEGDTSGYSMAAFWPKQTFLTVSKVCWSVNLTDEGARQWWEVAVMPVGHNPMVSNSGSPFAEPNAGKLYTDTGVTSPFTAVPPDAQTAIAAWSGVDGYKGVLRVNGAAFGAGETANDAQMVDAGNDIKTRYPACFTDNKNGTLTFTISGPGGVVKSNTEPGRFPAGPLKVVFKNHVYHPVKDGTPVSRTWHYDDIVITP